MPVTSTPIRCRTTSPVVHLLRFQGSKTRAVLMRFLRSWSDSSSPVRKRQRSRRRSTIRFPRLASLASSIIPAPPSTSGLSAGNTALVPAGPSISTTWARTRFTILSLWFSIPVSSPWAPWPTWTSRRDGVFQDGGPLTAGSPGAGPDISPELLAEESEMERLHLHVELHLGQESHLQPKYHLQ